MITVHGGAAIWCLMQTALLAGMGLVAMRLFARRATASAALAGVTAASMILAATLLIPVAIPPLLSTLDARNAVPDHRGTTSLTASETPARRAEAERMSGSPPLLELQAAWERLRTLATRIAVKPPDGDWTLTTVILFVFGIGAVVGLGRLAAAVALVIKLQRSAEPIVDPAMLQRLAELRELLGVKRRVALCESHGVASPALIGWRRPIVLLPTDRAGWSEGQVRATLAHELAHVVRGDFASRAATQFALALHFSQPLVHWLARRVALMQELATDRMAAEAVGGARAYSRDLSGLALRLDDHSRLRLEPVVLPAISSHLTRRLAMVRSQDGISAQTWHRYAARCAVAGIVFFGLGTIALRGESGARAGDVSMQTSAATGDSSPNVAASSVRFMELADSRLAFMLRPGELAQSRAFAPFASTASAFVQGQLELFLGPDDAKPQARFEVIDFIAYSIRSGRPEAEESETASPEKDDWMNVTMELAIRFTTPTDCSGWAADAIHGAERMEIDGLACVRLKVGDSPIQYFYLAQRDPFTAVATSDASRLGKLVEKVDESLVNATSEAFESNAFACTYDLTTVRLSDWDLLREFSVAALFLPREGSYSAPPEQPDPIAARKKEFVDGVRRVTLGIGLSPQSVTLAWRVVLDCSDEQTAGSVRGSVEFFQEFATGIVKSFDEQVVAAIKQDPGSEAEARDGYEAMTFTSRLLGEATLSPCTNRSTNDGLLLESTGKFPKLLMMLLGFEHMAPAYSSSVAE